jgi:hypothetical protein
MHEFDTKIELAQGRITLDRMQAAEQGGDAGAILRIATQPGDKVSELGCVVGQNVAKFDQRFTIDDLGEFSAGLVHSLNNGNPAPGQQARKGLAQASPPSYDKRL